MKTVFNNAQLAHVWAAQRQPSGRGSSMHFEGRTIYSYGTHFPIASFVDAKNKTRVVLYNCDGYSNSTSKHKSHVWGALHGLDVRVFHVPTDCVLGNNPGRVLSSYRERREAALLAATKARTRTAERLQEAQHCEAEARDFAQIFELPAPVFEPYNPEHFEGLIKAQRKALAEQNAQMQEARQKAAQERERREAARIAAYPEALKAWREHRRLADYNIIVYPDMPTELRLSHDGCHVETTRGASVPIADARRLWSMIDHVRHSRHAPLPLPMVSSASYPDVGEFQLRSISADGTAQVGCHTLRYEQTHAFAVSQGWAR